MRENKCAQFTLLLLSGKDTPDSIRNENSLSMKLPYILPYGTFTLLKDIELHLRRSEAHAVINTLVLDISEWLGQAAV